MSVASTVLVLGEQQGSGVLVAPGVVLTSAHVMGGAHHATVVTPRRKMFELSVVWTDAELDAALLQSVPVIGPAARPSVLATDRPVPGCQVLGYPRIQRYDSQKPDLDQFTCTVLPLAGHLRGVLTVELDHPPTEDAAGESPLAGLSGAPVFSEGHLVGTVRSVPRGRGHHRLECVPVSAVLADDVARMWLPHARPLPIGDHPADQRYEKEYADAVAATYRRTRVFGLDELGKRASEWDLDTAYIALEAAPRERGRTAPRAPTPGTLPRRIDELLADRPRALLRGDAGAGKTTLVWWLAAHAAAGTLGPGLAPLNGLVPFVVPLRTLRARGGGFPSPAGLPEVAGLMIDSAPEGWAGRVLAAGRALLLVDGLDEVGAADRDDAHHWLSGLPDRFPGTRCVVTVRPHAVAPDWLGGAGFEELSLLPLSGPDIEAFVAAWHDAARLDAGPAERADLDALEHDLVQQFRQNRNLAELARTPLLCAVICALHRLREGLLPETRWELYDSALTMLLGARDDRRKVDAPEGIRMSVEEHRQLLQRLAARLVRSGQTEFTREQALQRLERDLPGMPRVQTQGTPAEILTHLINRSGLLQERADDVFQFAHRTFQDFLAAKEFVEDDGLPELLRHCPDQQWHDVLLLAAGHCGRRDMPVLVQGLLKAGSETRKRDLKTALYVLAALCAQHSAWLDEGLHRRVRAAVRSVLPPRNPGQTAQLARLGAWLLPLLPGPSDVAADAMNSITDLISDIGGAAALPYARSYAEAGQAGRFAVCWHSFPEEDFARQVLPLVPPDQPIAISTVRQLRQLRELPRLTALMLIGDFPPEEISANLGGHALTRLGLSYNARLTTLDVFRSLDSSTLHSLLVDACPQLTGLDAVADLPALRRLTLGSVGPADRPLDLTPLLPATELRIHVIGIPRKLLVGAAAFGDRLTVE
ncbi:NACHT domain-containing protein [Streptomyces sp. NPDC090025]|uniref:NACHT domain-containing protein n=1 Tax=Streptomyces sp. NPDC090025 TaxID=3365922 RepID=UPI003833F4C0